MRLSISLMIACVALFAMGYVERAIVAARQASFWNHSNEYIPASEYVRDGLHTMFDAIENVGAGVHDSSSLLWVDLIGGLEMEMSAAAWTDSSYSCAGVNSGHVYWKTMPEYPYYPKYMTIEVVFKNCSGNVFGRNSLAFGGREYQRMNIVRSTIGNVWAMSYQKDGFIFEDAGTISALFQDTSSASERIIFVNGTLAETTDAYKEGFGISGVQAISVNPRGDYPFNGEICCIRLYTRRLDAEEVVRNAEIDKARFSLP